MRDKDKLRRAKRNMEVQQETLDEYRNTIRFLTARVKRLEDRSFEDVLLKFCNYMDIKPQFSESEKRCIIKQFIKKQGL